jgi:peroxiredoxin
LRATAAEPPLAVGRGDGYNNAWTLDRFPSAVSVEVQVMKSRNLVVGAVAAALVWGGVYSAALVASAADSQPAKKKALEIGNAGPAWEKLAGVDGKDHSLKDLKDAKAVVVAFITNHCPVAVAYEDRLNELYADYKDKGVELVAINVNTIEPDRLPKMKERAEEKGFQFQYLYDPSQKIGRAYGATVTPHVFLLDGERKVVYMGAIDDHIEPENAKQHYLRDAIDAVLEGKTPEVATSKQFGCGIQYE